MTIMNMFVFCQGVPYLGHTAPYSKTSAFTDFTQKIVNEFYKICAKYVDYLKNENRKMRTILRRSPNDQAYHGMDYLKFA